MEVDYDITYHHMEDTYYHIIIVVTLDTDSHYRITCMTKCIRKASRGACSRTTKSPAAVSAWASANNHISSASTASPTSSLDSDPAVSDRSATRTLAPSPATDIALKDTTQRPGRSVVKRGVVVLALGHCVRVYLHVFMLTCSYHDGFVRMLVLLRL